MSEFKPIPGFEDYLIGSDGTVVSVKHGKHKVLAGGTGARGYRLVTLCNGMRRKTGMIHRLVAEAFLGPSNLQVNHKNGIKTDNRLENLEYCNQSDNTRHALDTGLWVPRKGFDHHSAHLLETEVEVIKALRGVMPQSAIASLFGIAQSVVSNIQTGKRYA